MQLSRLGKRRTLFESAHSSKENRPTANLSRVVLGADFSGLGVPVSAVQVFE